MEAAAFTGHRPSQFSFGYDEEATLCIDIKNALLSQILLMYRNGVRRFYTGCAVGTELWAGELVLGLKKRKAFSEIELYCCIPFEEQAARWSAETRDRYYTMLENSTETILLQTQYSRDCFCKSNRYIVDHCHYLIAVCDSEKKGNSATAQMIHYAKSLNRGIVYINPDTAEVKSLTAIVTSKCNSQKPSQKGVSAAIKQN